MISREGRRRCVVVGCVVLFFVPDELSCLIIYKWKTLLARRAKMQGRDVCCP